MKIVCIAASFVPSTTANSIQVIKATHALAALGHEVTLIVPGSSSVSWESLKHQYGLETPFEIHWIKENLGFRRYDFAIKAVHHARALMPDMIYTWALQAAVFSLWLRIPTLLELHDRVTGALGPWLFRKFWWAKTPHLLLTNTQALAEALSQTYDLAPSPSQIRIAPNGVELERYAGLPSPIEARSALGLPEGFTAGYTGHFYAGRGMDLMLCLAQALPEIHFLWVGGQSEDVALWEIRLKAEGVENVSLTGFVDNASLPLYQAASDVLMMPYGTQIAGSGGGNSAEIASPMKMFEYMAAERAILTSDLPVIHEVLDETMAVFCPPEDLVAWRTALQDLEADEERRLKLARSARAAVQRYTWQARARLALADWQELSTTKMNETNE